MDIATTIQGRLDLFDLAPAQVNRRASLAEGTVESILKGVVPDLADLGRLGRVLVFDPYALIRGEDLTVPSRSPTRFKTPEGVAAPLAPEDVFLLARAAEVSRRGGWLLSLLARPCAIHARRAVTPISAASEPWCQGYSLAEQARPDLTVEQESPISSMQALLERLGVHVAWVEFQGATITAASLVEPEGLPLILLNSKSPRIRSKLSRRAALAHELCHLLHDGGERDLAVLSAKGALDPFEQRANGFAPAFLAPQETVIAAYQAKLSNAEDATAKAVILEFAAEWGLSPTGAVWHAKNCKLIPADQAERLSLERFPRTEAAFEGEVLRKEIPEGVSISSLVDGLYSDLVMDATMSDDISEARAGELLSL